MGARSASDSLVRRGPDCPSGHLGVHLGQHGGQLGGVRNGAQRPAHGPPSQGHLAAPGSGVEPGAASGGGAADLDPGRRGRQPDESRLIFCPPAPDAGPQGHDESVRRTGAGKLHDINNLDVEILDGMH